MSTSSSESSRWFLLRSGISIPYETKNYSYFNITRRSLCKPARVMR